jgi:hypothetical protein
VDALTRLDVATDWYQFVRVAFSSRGPIMQVDLRTNQFNVRLNEDEAARLEKLAAHYSVSPATVVRLLIKARSDELSAAEAKRSAKAARKR